MEELDSTLPKALRDKIDAKIDLGWFFDKALWEKSIARHQKWDMKKIFADFDADGDGKLDIYELARAFRALVWAAPIRIDHSLPAAPPLLLFAPRLRSHPSPAS
jgi:hypothetical protein